MNNKPTPETDDASVPYPAYLDNDMTCVVNADFARKLERERDEARALNTKCICMYCPKEYDRNDAKTPELLTNHILSCEKSPLVQLIKDLEVQLNAAEDERDQLRKVADELAKQLESFSYGEMDNDGCAIIKSLRAYNSLPHVQQRNKERA